MKQQNKWQIILLCSFVYFASYFTRKDFAAVLAALINQDLITKTMGGWIGTGLFICYGIGQVVCGILADRLPPKLLLSCGLILTGICNVLMPSALIKGLAVPLWAVNGFAQAFMWPPIVRIMADTLDTETFVTANLFVTSAAHISTILLYLYVPLCLHLFSWQFVFTSAAALASTALLCIIIGLSVVIPASTSMNHNTTRSTATHSFSDIIRFSGVLPLTICIMATGYLRDGIESWLPTLYCEAFQKGEQEGILLSAMLPVFSILSVTIITAAHRHRFFNHEARGSSLLFLAAAVICVPLCVFLRISTAPIRILCLILASLVCGCMHACNFLLISCLPGRFRKYGIVATVSGICNAFVYIGAAASMYGIPAISQVSGWTGVVVSWMIIALFGGGFALLGKRKYTQFIAK